MKLILSIVQDDDSYEVIEALNEASFAVTKLATTGGFLKKGNTTLLIGVEEDKVDKALSIIKNSCSERKQLVPATNPISQFNGFSINQHIEVDAGGATTFIIDVENFIKF